MLTDAEGHLGRRSYRRPTMQEVAKLAGVSLKTVSRVVNEEAGVNAPTAAAVSAAIEALDYRRNDIARNLRPGQRSYIFGLVIEDVANPFYASITRGAEDVAETQGFMVLAASSHEQPDREQQLLTRMLQRQVDGLLVVPTGRDHEFLSREARRGTPVIFLDRPAGNFEADLVVLDNGGGARLAVEHLLDRGHRRIGIVGNGRWVWTAAERLTGYRKALRAAGVAFDRSVVRMGPHTTEDAEEATVRLLSATSPPTALLTLNNRMTLGALRALRNSPSLRAELVGFDDLELADMLASPVTVVAHDAEELGRAAARLLLARLDGDRSPPQTVVIPTRLVVRGRGIDDA